ncbi:hypothetical protein MML48_8g00008802 [Holotrichia oblita]|uniref:Uncharacterized protein n=1 Tax=Holotrichia oblita TaxID=644536 RepID=A0ACB9SS96_HOLOL|nr:hypothetical protein MML48_8g00008802 [Holotrichia oblita]
MLEEDELPHSSGNIVMMPPHDGDENFGQEDEMSPDNLPPTQLRAPAEIHVLSQDYDSDDENIPLAQLASKKTKHLTKVTKLYYWTDNHIPYK